MHEIAFPQMRQSPYFINFVSYPTSTASTVLSVALLLGAQLGLLSMMGRPLSCPCCEVAIWQGALDPSQNSQQLFDPYALLHGVYGILLFLWLSTIRPSWPTVRTGLVAIACSVAWEVMENLPPIVRRFGAEGTGLHYVGDSLLNSAGDTFAVSLGFLLASKLPLWISGLSAVLIELLVWNMIGDSLIASGIRFISAA